MSGYGSIVRGLPVLGTLLLFAVGVGIARTPRSSVAAGDGHAGTAPALRFRLRRLGGLPDPELPDGWEYGLHGRWALFRRVDGGRSHVTIKPVDGGWHVRYFDEGDGEIERGTLTAAPVGFDEALAIATGHVHGRGIHGTDAS